MPYRVNKLVGMLALGLTAALFGAACDEGVGSSSGGTGGDGATGSTSTGSASGGGGGGSLTLDPIDDMEDQDGSIIASAGRRGAWYTYNDETAGAVQTPIVGDPFTMGEIPKPNGASTYAANTNGSGFETWGAGMGFDLNNDGTTKDAYDGSKYAGITFWAMTGPGGIANIRVNVGDSQTTPEAGNCVPAECSDDFGASITLTEEWQQFTLRFSDLTQVGWAMQNLTAIDAAGLYYVHFQASQMTTFDLWIDDIAFFEE